jgi:A/G-specific adenine glycosylase
MLQQTRVGTVLDRWDEWMARFPDLDSLAAATEEQVIEAWAGLGYYRRARMLHAGARHVAERGEWPADAREWLEVPGVGAYTAGAIAAVALGQPGAVVDGNVERVLARLSGLRESARKGAGRKTLESASAELLACGDPGTVLEALFDLGATLCTPRNPECERCPWRSSCVASSEGATDHIPVLPARKATRDVHRVHLVIDTPQGVLLRRARPDEYATSLWVFPHSTFLASPPDEHAALILAGSEGLTLASPPHRIGTIRTTITHHRITGTIWRAELAPGDLPAGHEPTPLESLPDRGLPAADQRIATLLTELDPPPGRE